MAVVGEKMDLIAQLPDEVLCHVLSFLSLSDKLRSESVNHKFQRCVREELNGNPQPLELDLEDRTLNGYRVPLDQMFDALQSLAKRAKFNSVEIGLDLCPRYTNIATIAQRMDMVLSLLIQSQCLSKVTSFVSYAGCSQTILRNFLDNCGKLSTIKLEFDVRPLKSKPDDLAFPLDLGQILKNKFLTELAFCPFRYPQKGLAQAFRAIEANSLRKLILVFNEEILVTMTQLVDALSPHGSALVELQLHLYKVDVQLADLFQSLKRLPALRKCDIRCVMLQPSDQLVVVATSLFKNSHIEISLSADHVSLFSLDLPGCQIVNMISQIQEVHPSLVVDFDSDQYGGSLILKLGKASIQKMLSMEAAEECIAENCVQCRSFYPCLLNFLRVEAQDAALNFEDTQYFPDRQLDRCKVEKIVDDLGAGPDTELWIPLSVEFSEVQQSVTINFETADMEPYPFSITVGCGRCLTNGCMKCVK